MVEQEPERKERDLIETTDSLEAVGVIRGWKNFLFIIVILGLITVQLCFWLVKVGGVSAAEGVKTETPQTKELTLGSKVPELPEAEAKEAGKTAEEVVVGEPNQAEADEPEAEEMGAVFSFKTANIAWIVRLCDFVLIIASALYCLSLLFAFKVSLLGRLGGINHICRAFYLSVLMIVLLFPWQVLFSPVVSGAMFTPSELIKAGSVEAGNVFSAIFHYLRFTGYWFLVLMVAVCAQLRSVRWAKATLKRLEVM